MKTMFLLYRHHRMSNILWRYRRRDRYRIRIQPI